LLHAEAVVSGVDDGDDLSFGDDATEIYRERADATRNFYADGCLIVGGECAVGGYSFAERCLGDSRSFNFTCWTTLAGTSLALSLRGLVVTLARGQKKRRQ
jgi:hypothetical protein